MAENKGRGGPEWTPVTQDRPGAPRAGIVNLVYMISARLLSRAKLSFFFKSTPIPVFDLY